MTTAKRTAADIFESVFDIAYLTFDAIALLVFLVQGQGQPVFMLYALLVALLGGGDAFHLVPRVQRHLFGENDRTQRRLGLGLLVSSITMTLFYLVLFEIYRQLVGTLSPAVSAAGTILAVAALLRIALCLFPQNNWFSAEGNQRWSIYRNLPFLVVGVIMMVLEASLHTAYGIQMAAAIATSFGCYVPVTLLAKRIPAIGALMMPKTLAYVWMICLGLAMLT
jgi:hypothetical protein